MPVSVEIPTQDQAPQETVITFENVDFSHPNGTVALLGVNFTISKGELIAILGSNGAGKTTLVRHINGLLKPTHGVVRVFGQDTKLVTSATLSRRVGIVFQNPNNQLFAQSVRKEIEFALKNFGFSPELIEQRLKWALNTFSLSEYAEKPPMELSGGEKKRLCIALVLAWDPDILILDEPTVGQDSEQKERLTQMISLFLSQNKTVILVTHDVEFVWPLQPRVLLMSEGRIVSDGPCQKILSDVEKTSAANVRAPELVEFSGLMGWDPPLPSNPFEARDRLTQMRSRGS